MQLVVRDPAHIRLKMSLRSVVRLVNEPKTNKSCVKLARIWLDIAQIDIFQILLIGFYVNLNEKIHIFCECQLLD